MKLNEIEGTYECDECQARFVANEIVLEPAHSNASFFMTSLLCVANDGTIMNRAESFEEGDRTLHCPKCGAVHLFGFTKVEV